MTGLMLVIKLIGPIKLVQVIHFNGYLQLQYIMLLCLGSSQKVALFQACESWFWDQLFPREISHLGTTIASPLSRV